MAESFAPPERLTVSEWAERYRVISAESGSPFPGEWRHFRAPHLVEIMEAFGLDDPVQDVWVKKSAQVGVTECGVTAMLQRIDAAPGPMMYVLPTVDEALKFNRVKLEPSIDACERVKARIVPETVKGKAGSTQQHKRFLGGFLILANAHTSTSLQMISVRDYFGDEVSEWPLDAGGRGDPDAQAKARTKAWEDKGCKRARWSTPGIKGHCRISAGYAKSDLRRFYTACPQCGSYQVLSPARFKWRSDTPPHGGYFVCQARDCGGVIERADLYNMVNDRGGRLWIKTYVDEQDPEGNPAPPAVIEPEDFDHWRARPSNGRDAGFHIWQGQSLLATWEGIAESHLEATTPEKRRAHVQQVEGEDYEEKGEAPDAEKLLLGREPRVLPSVPREYPVLTGALDVQGSWLEWAVYAWRLDGGTLSSALVDFDIIKGETSGPEPWAKFDEVRNRRFPVEGLPDHPGLRPALWHLDAGYNTARVYQFCRLRGGAEGRLQPIMGEQPDSRLAPYAPLVSQPKAVSYTWEGKPVKGEIDRRNLGSWPLKQLLYEGLRQTLLGPDEETGKARPGSIRFGARCDERFFEQITAESLITRVDRHGRSKRQWVKRHNLGNEQLDLWCYARAAAEQLELPTLPLEWWADYAASQGLTEQPAQPELFGPAATLREEAKAETLPPVATPEREAGNDGAVSPASPRRQVPPTSPAAGSRFVETRNFWSK
ncbi:MAG: terminase gpA endonuclease subunit [Pseudomonadota bacterium]